MSWQSFVPRRLPRVFHGRYRRHAFGGCGCGTLFVCVCLAAVAISFLQRR